MLEIFSNGSQALAQNAQVAFTNIKFSDCRYQVNNTGTSVVVKTPGRYLVSFDAVGGSTTADTAFTIQMYVNGVAQPCAQTTNTASDANAQGALGFTTLIQVNNSCCSINNNQTLTFVATAATAGSITHANLAIIRL